MTPVEQVELNQIAFCYHVLVWLIIVMAAFVVVDQFHRWKGRWWK